MRPVPPTFRTQRPSSIRRPLFLVATLLVPVVVLGGLELALRWAGFGASRPLFVDAANAPGYRHAGSDVMWRYYTATQEVAASIDPILFRSEKPADVLRLVVQGASSAAGFPYGRWAGLAGMLADRIEASHPHLSIEVITTAMAAVSTYTLLDLVDEIIAVEPDAVLIYAGHNEYLGVMGVASSLAGGASRPVALLRLRLGGLRLYQLVDALIRRVRATPATGSDRQSLFERAAAGSRVAPGSELDARGVAQLESNLSAILERYRAAGIPVYLATLVSNERDQPPFSGGPSADVDPDAWLQGWMRHDAFRLAERDAQARAELESLLVLDDEAADVWYALGGLEERAGDFERARVAYGRARDLDRLRFRAPSAMNDAIRALAEQKGAILVDVEARFRDASDHRIPGGSLLLEHVHPNADGYFLLAAAFYDALMETGLLGEASVSWSEEQARLDMPITQVDRILAAYDVAELKSGFPFRTSPEAFMLPPPRSETEAIAQRLRTGDTSWLDAMDRQMQIHRREGDIAAAAVVARVAAQAQPFDYTTNLAAGLLLLELERPAQARRYLERSQQAKPGDRRVRRALARATHRAGRVLSPH